jgi:uncharacterized membrane protein YkvA (DUF1232 family)
MKFAALGAWKDKARKLETEVYVLYLAVKDPRTPWYARAFVAVIVAYILSPVDLIPDFIPVLGYLDDLLILPAGIYLTLKMVPRDVMEEHRMKAVKLPIAGRSRWIAAAIIVIVWLLVIYLVVMAIWL